MRLAGAAPRASTEGFSETLSRVPSPLLLFDAKLSRRNITSGRPWHTNTATRFREKEFP
jgi:hypothetical protein